MIFINKCLANLSHEKTVSRDEHNITNTLYSSLFLRWYCGQYNLENATSAYTLVAKNVIYLIICCRWFLCMQGENNNPRVQVSLVLSLIQCARARRDGRWRGKLLLWPNRWRIKYHSARRSASRAFSLAFRRRRRRVFMRKKNVLIVTTFI